MDKKGHDFVLDKEIRSSVTRLTLSLNKGYWVDESVDIYELINNEFESKSVILATGNKKSKPNIKNIANKNFFIKRL